MLGVRPFRLARARLCIRRMSAEFVTTSWSLIAHTREPGNTARQATAALCEQYWRPLYFYSRRFGHSPHEAEDTVQEFLIHVVENDVFARADADRGRFRTFLLSALRQFLNRQHRDQTRQKRSPQGKLRSLDIERVEQSLSNLDHESPDRAFDRAWALTQLDLTWQRVEAEFTEGGKSALIRQLRPVISGRSDTPMKDIAAELGMTEGAVNVAAHRVRRRFGEVLREQIGHTLVSTDEIDDEIARLRTALSGSSE